jgi:hypothetical protein
MFHLSELPLSQRSTLSPGLLREPGIFGHRPWRVLLVLDLFAQIKLSNGEGFGYWKIWPYARAGCKRIQVSSVDVRFQGTGRKLLSSKRVRATDLLLPASCAQGPFMQTPMFRGTFA